MLVHIHNEQIIHAFRESGYFCQLAPIAGDWYQIDCSLDHLKLYFLPTGLSIVLTGTVLQTQTALEQEWKDQLATLSASERIHMPDLPPYWAVIHLPQKQVGSGD